MSNFTLGLAMIAKDEDKELEKLFESIKGVFDDMVVAWNGTNPKTKEICEKYGVRVVPYEWIDDFAHARNFSYSLLNTDMVMWLDADDELINADQLRQTITNGFNRPGINVLELPYHYDHDESGNCVMTLWLARVIKKGTFSWKGAIHEALLPVQDFQKCRAENVYVKHNVDPERVQRSAERNLRISKREYEKEHANNTIDPRTTLYYAKALNATGNYGGAIEVFEQYLDQSEWDDERYQVLCILADLHTRSRQYVKATDFARRALTLRPLYGQAYFELASINYRTEKWEDCTHLVKIGMNSIMPDALLPTDPMEYKFKPLILLEMCYFQTGNPQESLTCINKALEFKPKNEHMLQRREAVKGFLLRMQLEDSALKLAHWLSSNDDKEKLKLFVASLPEVVRDHPTFIRLTNQFHREAGDLNKMTIFCGPTFETWSPDTAKTKGLGGSEEAVVYLAKEFVKLGWVVDVYCNCDATGLHDGVTYKNFWEHDKERPTDIFIAWRNSEYVEQAPQGSRVFVWLHDRQKPDYWTPERIERTEKIFVLSKYHRKDLPDIPDEKFVISRNGIVASQFAIAPKVPKDPVKCFYGSSPDRGLDVLLELWPEIRKEVPDAHLHVFYGFSKTYDMLHKDHANMMEFKDRVLKMLQQDGVHYHGRVSHAELSEHMMTSGLWLYPTHFTEISCITAMKAQAAGAIPVTMTLAALDETVQYGYKISFGIQDTRSRKAFVNIVVDLLKNPEKQDNIRKDMMPWALDFYRWENVALQWHEIFKPEASNLILPGNPEFQK